MFLDLKQKYSKLYIIWKVFLSRVQWFLLHQNPIVYKKVIAFRVFFDIREIWVKRVMIKCKVAGLVVKIEKNGLQILVRHEILHKIGYVNEKVWNMSPVYQKPHNFKFCV